MGLAAAAQRPQLAKGSSGPPPPILHSLIGGWGVPSEHGLASHGDAPSARTGSLPGSIPQCK